MTSRTRSLILVLATLVTAFVGSPGKLQAQILVSDVGSNSIKMYNQNTGAFIKTLVSSGSGGLSVPFGLAFGPDRNLYVSSLGTGEILSYNGTTGAFLSKVVSKGSGGLSYPNQVLFGPDQNMYVANFSPTGNGAVLQYEGPNGSAPGSFIKTFASDANLKGPTGMAFSGSGDQLFVSSSTNNALYSFNGYTGALLNGGALVPGAASGLNGPAGLSVGPDGNLYVANFFPTAPGQPTGIMRYDLADPGNAHSSFTGTLDLNGPVTPVFAIDAIAQQSFLYVPSYGNNTIYRFNPLTGKFDTNWTLTGGNLINPTYMLVTPGALAEGIAPVPEPTSIALTGLGLLGLAGLLKKKQRRTLS